MAPGPAHNRPMTPDQVTTSLPDTVLVVDDEPTVVNLLTVALKRVGLVCQGASTAEEAFVALETGTFGAVVTDKNLPGASGLEVIRRAREKQPHCAAILITAYVNTESVLEALRLGANDYILKPFSNLMLVAQRVKQAIEHQRVAFERSLLAEALRGYEARIKRSEAQAFQHSTELELFQNVLDVRVQDATSPLLERITQLEGELAEERAIRARTREVLLELAQSRRQPPSDAGPSMFPSAASTPTTLAERLEAEADRLA